MTVRNNAVNEIIRARPNSRQAALGTFNVHVCTNVIQSSITKQHTPCTLYVYMLVCVCIEKVNLRTLVVVYVLYNKITTTLSVCFSLALHTTSVTSYPPHHTVGVRRTTRKTNTHALRGFCSKRAVH